MPLALIIALLAGGGVSLAAENALPGDILYPVKVRVNEEVRGLVIFRASERAGWEAARAARRLEEGEQLAVRGRLDAETRTRIEFNFAKHAERVAERVEGLKAGADIAAAAEVASRFETSLAAHARILERLREEKGEAQDPLGSIAAAVQRRAGSAAKKRAELEAEFESGQGGDMRHAAYGKRRSAENKIAEIAGLIERSRAMLGPEAAADAEARLKGAREMFQEAVARFGSGAYGEAFALFRKAQRIAEEAKLLIEAKKRLEIRVELDDRKSERREAGRENNATGERRRDQRTRSEIETQTEVRPEGDGAAADRVKLEIDL